MPRFRVDSGTPEEPLLIRYAHRSWLFPLCLTVAIIVVDANTGRELRIVNWLVLVPITAACLCSARVTACYAVVSALLYPLLSHALGRRHLTWADWALVAIAGLLAVPLAVYRARATRFVRHLQGTAETTRQVVLRQVPARWGGLESASRYLAADAEARVGGDFYDVLDTPHGARVILGDVQGKGLPAVATAASLVGAFREAGFYETDLAVVAAHLEDRLARHNLMNRELGVSEERFATAVVLAFPLDEPGTVLMVNFGHDGPYVVSPAGVRQLPDGSGSPVGMAELVGTLPPIVRFPLAADETVLITSDGVTEARDSHDRFFPLADSLAELVPPAGTPTPAAAGAIAPQRVIDHVVKEVLAHTRGRLADDTALLAVRRITDAADAVPLTADLPDYLE